MAPLLLLKVLMLELIPNNLDHHLQEALTQDHHHLLLLPKAHMDLLLLLKAHTLELTLNNQDLPLQVVHTRGPPNLTH